MNEDRRLVPRQHDIRLAWKIGTMQAKPIAHAMQHRPHDQFGLRVSPGDP